MIKEASIWVVVSVAVVVAVVEDSLSFSSSSYFCSSSLVEKSRVVRSNTHIYPRPSGRHKCQAKKTEELFPRFFVFYRPICAAAVSLNGEALRIDL